MNSLSFYLFLPIVLATALIVSTIFELVDWKWKMQPWRLTAAGMALLVLALFAEEFAYIPHIDKGKAFVSQDCPAFRGSACNPSEIKEFEAAKEFYKVNIRHMELATKWMELVLLPLAVSFVVAGLLIKVDRQYEDMRGLCESALGEIEYLENEVEKLVLELKSDLNTSARGNEIIKAAELIRIRKREIAFRRYEVRSSYGSLVPKNYFSKHRA